MQGEDATGPPDAAPAPIGQWNRWLWWWANASYGIGGLLFAAYAALGAIGWWVSLAYLASVVVGQGIIYYLFSTGRNRRFADPSLRGFIAVESYGRQMVFYLLAPEVGWLSLLHMFSVFSYAALTATQRQLLLRLGGVALFLVATFPLVGERLSIPFATPLEKLLVISAILLEIGRCGHLSGHVAHMRTRLRQKRREAEEANRKLSQAIDTLQHTRAQLVEAEKLGALGHLVAGVAHELNTPLGNCILSSSAMQSQLDALRQRITQGELKRADLDGFLAVCDEGLDLLQRNLAAASRRVQSFKEIEAGAAINQRGRFELQALVEDVVTRNAVFGSGTYYLDRRIPAGLTLDSYPGALERVLAALLSNAVVHGFAGRPMGRIRIEATAAGDEVRIVVADDGNGIAAEHLPRIFEPFFTTQLGQGGSGLGLSTVRSLVVGALGGKVSAGSTPGAGSEFVLSLPRVAPQAPSH